jgi:hypothetical protein
MQFGEKSGMFREKSGISVEKFGIDTSYISECAGYPRKLKTLLPPRSHLVGIDSVVIFVPRLPLHLCI